MTRRLKPTEKRRLQRQQNRQKQPDEPKQTKRVDVTISLLFDEPLTIEAIESWDAKFDSIDSAAQDAGLTLAESLSCAAWHAEIKEYIAGIDD